MVGLLSSLGGGTDGNEGRTDWVGCAAWTGVWAVEGEAIVAGEGEAAGADAVVGFGGGGIAPLEGPYCMMGRKDELPVGAGFGSFTAYMVASNTCGSTVIVTWPILVIVSLGGLLESSFTTPFRLVGFVQYFSNTPSFIHFWRDLDSDSAITPLERRWSELH